MRAVSDWRRRGGPAGMLLGTCALPDGGRKTEAVRRGRFWEASRMGGGDLSPRRGYSQHGVAPADGRKGVAHAGCIRLAAAWRHGGPAGMLLGTCALPDGGAAADAQRTYLAAQGPEESEIEALRIDPQKRLVVQPLGGGPNFGMREVLDALEQCGARAAFFSRWAAAFRARGHAPARAQPGLQDRQPPLRPPRLPRAGRGGAPASAGRTTRRIDGSEKYTMDIWPV